MEDSNHASEMAKRMIELRHNCGTDKSGEGRLNYHLLDATDAVCCLSQMVSRYGANAWPLNQTLADVLTIRLALAQEILCENAIRHTAETADLWHASIRLWDGARRATGAIAAEAIHVLYIALSCLVQGSSPGTRAFNEFHPGVRSVVAELPVPISGTPLPASIPAMLANIKSLLSRLQAAR